VQVLSITKKWCSFSGYCLQRFSAPGQHPVSSRFAVACNQSDFVFLGKPCMGATAVYLSRLRSL